MVAVTGTGSGLDIDGIVDAIVSAERVPAETRFNSKEANLTAMVSAYGAVRSAVSSFEIATSTLAKSSTFSERTASSSDQTKATIRASNDASLGSYQLSISSLASSQTIASGNFTSTSDTLGTGTLTVSLGTPTYTGATYSSFSQSSTVDITVDSSNNTLAGVRDAINAASAGVNASIVKNGAEYQLLLVSENTGLANSMEITVTGDSIGTDTDNTGLSKLSFGAAASQMTQYAAGGDAAFTLNGLPVTSASNTVADALDGVTLNLLSETTSAITVEVASDRAGVTADVQAFVDAYNEYTGLVKELTKYDAATGVAGILQGDSSTRSFITQIRSELGKKVPGLSGPYQSLADVGVSIDRNGTMSLSQSTLSAAMNDDNAAVSAVFAATTQNGKSTDGVAEKVETLVESFLTGGGLFDAKISGLNTQLADLADDRASLARRLASLEDRFFSQLNAMDSLLAEIETTGSFLTQQFEAMKPQKN